jgi:MFS family permease
LALNTSNVSSPPSRTQHAIKRTNTWLPLRNHAFGLLWLFSLTSGSLVTAQDVAIRWLVHRVSPSTFLLSLIPSLSSAAFFLLTFPGGILADRWPRNRSLSLVYIGLGVASAVLAAISSLSNLPAELVLLLALLFGAGLALSAPVWAALFVEIVEKPDVETAVALSGVQINLSGILGPALAGLLLPQFGPRSIFMAGALTFVGVSLAMKFLPQVAKGPPANPSSLRETVAEVKRFIQRRAQVRTVIFRNLLFNFFVALIPALLPTFGLKVLKISSGELGLLFTALGIGSILGGVFLVPFLQKKLSPNRITVVACILLIIVFYLIGFVRQRFLFLAVAAVAGSSWTLAATEIWAVGQRATPDASRGRINAVLMMTGSGAQALGGMIWAAMATAAGLENAIHIAAISLLLSLPIRVWWPLDKK